MNWSHITNWRLAKGSHKFPGPDGGTCINEAAIVAAGLEYRRVNSFKQLPPCFSPILGEWLIIANDKSSDTERQQLMKFVNKLSGTNHGAEREQERIDLLIWMVERIPVARSGYTQKYSPVENVIAYSHPGEYIPDISITTRTVRAIHPELKSRIFSLGSNLNAFRLNKYICEINDFIALSFQALAVDFPSALRIANLLYEIAPAPDEPAPQVWGEKLETAKKEAKLREKIKA